MAISTTSNARDSWKSPIDARCIERWKAICESKPTIACLSQVPTDARPRSYLVAVLGDVSRAGLRQARSYPAAAWWRWALALLGGYVLTWVVVIATVSIARGWVDQGLQAWDEQVLAQLAESWFSYPAGLWFEAWASSAFLVPMLVVAAVLLIRGGHLLRALTLLVGYLSVKGLVLGAWQLWDRARPEMIAGGIASPGLHSFPSGHAVNAMVMFGLLGIYWWRASRAGVERCLIVAAIGLVIALTCVGRVRLGTHWPSDVAGGLVIGIAWLVALGFAVALAERAASRAAE